MTVSSSAAMNTSDIAPAVRARPGSAILVANLGTVVGGLITFGKGIAHDDGLLHACIYSPGNFLDATRIFTPASEIPFATAAGLLRPTLASASNELIIPVTVPRKPTGSSA